MEVLHQTFWYWHGLFLSWPIVATVLVILLVVRARQYQNLKLPVQSLLLRQGALMGLLWLGFQVLHQSVRHNSRSFLCCIKGGCSCLTEQTWMLLIAFFLAFWVSTPSPASLTQDNPLSAEPDSSDTASVDVATSSEAT